MKTLKLVLPAVVAAAALFAGAAQAQAARTGKLICDIAPGVGIVIGSQKALTCRYDSFNGRQEFYSGTISKIGVDLGATTGGQIIWAVFEPALMTGGLAGNYAGASAEVTLGAGIGAHVLVGGGNGGITLQPLSVQVQTGLNVAAGIGAMSLTQVAPPRARVYFPKRHRHHHRHH